ncbi:histidine phosphatase family protein [Weissella soli]|uniref:histidine phosphatase family protein n=1 Tax=Weissella soli TaxID=155866 RepID=UPI0021C05D5D|nr:histidine phosphatase family protein [Weissella soli]MCT8394841.1 histidine phosphatase family protein [Weissella soli]
MLNLYLIRHGQTYYNRYNKLQGWSNAPLTDQGRADAVSVGKRLADIEFKAAYSSDTTRAIDTANMLLAQNAYAVPALISDWHFREEFYGSYEGSNMDKAWLDAGAPVGLTTYAEIVDQYGVDKTKDLLKAADPWHDAEDSTAYWQRVDAGFAMILANPALQDGDNVLVISHGNTLISLAERYGAGKIQIHERPTNGSVTQIALTTDSLHIIKYNDQVVE